MCNIQKFFVITQKVVLNRNIAVRGASLKVLRKRTVGCSHTDNVSVMWEVFHCNTCRGTGVSDYSLVSVWVHVSAPWFWCSFHSQNKCYKRKTSWVLSLPFAGTGNEGSAALAPQEKANFDCQPDFRDSPHAWVAVGWGTALQARRSRVRFPMVSLEFFVDITHLALGWLIL